MDLPSLSWRQSSGSVLDLPCAWPWECSGAVLSLLKSASRNCSGPDHSGSGAWNHSTARGSCSGAQWVPSRKSGGFPIVLPYMWTRPVVIIFQVNSKPLAFWMNPSLPRIRLTCASHSCVAEISPTLNPHIQQVPYFVHPRLDSLHCCYTVNSISVCYPLVTHAPPSQILPFCCLSKCLSFRTYAVVCFLL